MRHVYQSLIYQMPYFSFALPHAEDAKKRSAKHLSALLLQNLGPDDDVHVAGLVFNRHKNDALRGFGALPYCNNATGAGELTMAVLLQRSGGHQSFCVQLRTQQFHWMPAERQPH